MASRRGSTLFGGVLARIWWSFRSSSDLEVALLMGVHTLWTPGRAAAFDSTQDEWVGEAQAQRTAASPSFLSGPCVVVQPQENGVQLISADGYIIE